MERYTLTALEPEQDVLVLRKDRSVEWISVLFVVLAIGFVGGLIAALFSIGTRGHDGLEMAGALIACVAAGYYVYCETHRLIHDKGMVLKMTNDRVFLNEQWLKLGEVDSILLLAASPHIGGWSYHVGIRDTSGHTRMLLWFTGRDTAERLVTFLARTDIRITRSETSWRYRLKDICWGKGLWQ